MNRRPLPIDAEIPSIVEALRDSGVVVVEAEPGAGKTTRVPPAILEAGLAGARQVVVVEPRRVAARAAAAWVAKEAGETVGDRVGYRVRFESRGDARTRLWFVTDGIFARRLLDDPFLEEVGVLVLDEVHERRVLVDFAAAAAVRLRESVRPDLRMVVMSATMDAPRIASRLGGAPVLRSAGRPHPVEVRHLADTGRMEPRIHDAVVRALRETSGDVLVFLPGIREIRRAAESLAGIEDTDVRILHGMLPLEEQQRALAPGPRRRVVLSTNVAETSLTVEGVTAVVDSGVARETRFDARRGINALTTSAISRAAADQRAGRAGRTGPGVAYRLWSEADHRERRADTSPEILRVDLADLVLTVHGWGLGTPRDLAWIDPPPEGHRSRAEGLLESLGALRRGAITPTGRALLEIPVPPRLARVLVEARGSGAGRDAALVVALASERDIVKRAPGAGPWPSHRSDLLLRLELLREWRERGSSPAHASADVDVSALRAVERAALPLGSSDASESGRASETAILRSILAGYAERVCRRREPGSPRALMVGGTGVVLHPGSSVRDADLFVAIDLDAGDRSAHREAVVHLASEVRAEWLEELFPEDLHRDSRLLFDPARERVVSRTEVRFRDLVLDARDEMPRDRSAAGEILAEVARDDPERIVTIRPEDRRLLERLRFLRRNCPAFGQDESPVDLLRDVAAELCVGRISAAEVRRLDLGRALRRALRPEERTALDRDAPERLLLPDGRSVAVGYEANRPPRLSVRIQQIFGWRDTPRIAGVPVLLEILAPSRRPVQVTDDLAGFWERTYPEVRRELRGRYPKHAWPENPTIPADRA